MAVGGREATMSNATIRRFIVVPVVLVALAVTVWPAVALADRDTYGHAEHHWVALPYADRLANGLADCVTDGIADLDADLDGDSVPDLDADYPSACDANGHADGFADRVTARPFLWQRHR
jgi:hypothetical protein